MRRKAQIGYLWRYFEQKARQSRIYCVTLDNLLSDYQNTRHYRDKAWQKSLRMVSSSDYPSMDSATTCLDALWDWSLVWQGFCSRGASGGLWCFACDRWLIILALSATSIISMASKRIRRRLWSKLYRAITSSKEAPYQCWETNGSRRFLIVEFCLGNRFP